MISVSSEQHTIFWTVEFDIEFCCFSHTKLEPALHIVIDKRDFIVTHEPGNEFTKELAVS